MIDLIEHTNLNRLATERDIDKLCMECQKHGFRSVCIPPHLVKYARTHYDIRITTVVGFPYGWGDKLSEAEIARDNGADEIDVVWNCSHFKQLKFLKILKELSSVVEAFDGDVKIIVEDDGFLLYERKVSYHLVEDSGAAFIKTGTGTVLSANVETIRYWKTLGSLKIKAAGGIKDVIDVKNMLSAGADIIGTSHGLAILKELQNA